VTQVASTSTGATPSGLAAAPPDPSESVRARAEDVTKQHRLDIQALRAVAVTGVVVYHLFPRLLPGGFVGVDVFFVISGFLITSHLLSLPPRHARDFGRFWSRRALRLLPPVVVVILSTLGGVVLFVPAGQWKALAREAVTSMLYVQNWQLVSEATDYLDAQRAVSPFQHFWSLSVEEQYYVMWPLLVALLTWGALRLGRSPRLVVGCGFLVAVAVSFGWGLYRTSAAPAEAYFSTWTRMWELGVGSLLAAVYPVLVRRLGVPLRTALFWGGLAGIGIAYGLITARTPFPGYAALLPTLATAAAIMANDPRHAANPRWLSHSTPVQLVGDTSYALYLWHWPLIVLAPYALGHAAQWWDKLVLVVLALLLAWASTRFLEGPVRGSVWLKARLRRVFVMSAAITALVVLASVALTAHTNQQIAAASADVARAISSERPCFGAGALDPKHDCPATTKLITSPEFAKEDYSDGIDPKKCLNWMPEGEPVVCHRGDTHHPVKRIALVGNSHAGQWLEAVSKIGRLHHWQVDTYLFGACYVVLDHADDPCVATRPATASAVLNGDYDLVVLSTNQPPNATAKTYVPTLHELSAAGEQVLVIRDTPAPNDPAHTTPDCVAEHLDDLDACAGRANKWIIPDRLTQAARKVGRDDASISRVSVNRYICRDGVCPAAVGGVIVYRDENHLTVTYAMSLVPYLEPAMTKVLGG